MKLNIKNMVTLRCIIVVKSVLEKLNLIWTKIEINDIQIDGNLNTVQRNNLAQDLKVVGLELIEDKQLILVENIKSVINDFILNPVITSKTNFSNYLTNKLKFNYKYLAYTFSKVIGITIEQYIIDLST